MSDDGDASALAPVPGDDLMLAVQPEGVLVEGHQSDVEHYVRRLREQAATQGLDPAEIRATDVANLGSLAVAGASYAAQSGKFLQLSADSMKALKHGKVIPGDGGFLRMMTRGADGKFLKQLQWKPTSVNPQRLMSAQMIALQIALSTAIAGIEESLARLDGKVDAVLQLAEADRAGDVLGHHATLTSLVTYLEHNGSLPDALWDSISGLNPSLNTVLERLRNHVHRVLATLDPTLESVADRSTALRKAIRTSKITETLDLLVVAEDSLFKWQRLLIARVCATEPDHFEGVANSSRAVLAKQLELDGRLYQHATAVTENVARRDDMDGFRIWSLQKLTADRDLMRGALNDFALARRHQAESWERLEIPGVLEATSAAVDLALESTGRAVSSAGVQVMKFGAYLAEREHDRVPRTLRDRRATSNGQSHRSTSGSAGTESDRPQADPDGGRFRARVRVEARRRLGVLIPDADTTAQGQTLRNANLTDDDRMRTAVLQHERAAWQQFLELASDAGDASLANRVAAKRIIRRRIRDSARRITAAADSVRNSVPASSAGRRFAEALAAELGTQKANFDLEQWASTLEPPTST